MSVLDTANLTCIIKYVYIYTYILYIYTYVSLCISTWPWDLSSQVGPSLEEENFHWIFALAPGGRGNYQILSPNNTYLVGGLEHEFYFSIQLGIIIPTDFHIFSEGLKPPTRY